MKSVAQAAHRAWWGTMAAFLLHGLIVGTWVSRIPGVQLVPGGQRRLSVLSFNIDGVHPHDVGTVLDQHNVAVRVGHHCAQPVMSRFGVAATTRASLAFYNTKSELDALADGIRRVQDVFKR